MTWLLLFGFSMLVAFVGYALVCLVITVWCKVSDVWEEAKFYGRR